MWEAHHINYKINPLLESYEFPTNIQIDFINTKLITKISQSFSLKKWTFNNSKISFKTQIYFTIQNNIFRCNPYSGEGTRETQIPWRAWIERQGDCLRHHEITMKRLAVAVSDDSLQTEGLKVGCSRICGGARRDSIQDSKEWQRDLGDQTFLISLDEAWSSGKVRLWSAVEGTVALGRLLWR